MKLHRSFQYQSMMRRRVHLRPSMVVVVAGLGTFVDIA